MKVHTPSRLSRREALQQAGAGAGILGLASLLQDGGQLKADDDPTTHDPLAPKKTHFAAKAKRVIWNRKTFENAQESADVRCFKVSLNRWKPYG